MFQAQSLYSFSPLVPFFAKSLFPTCFRIKVIYRSIEFLSIEWLPLEFGVAQYIVSEVLPVDPVFSVSIQTSRLLMNEFPKLLKSDIHQSLPDPLAVILKLCKHIVKEIAFTYKALCCVLVSSLIDFVSFSEAQRAFKFHKTSQCLFLVLLDYFRERSFFISFRSLFDGL